MTTSLARHPENVVQRSVAELAAEAMYREIALTPKPGLVDRANNGAHQDMTFTLFMDSIAVITPWYSLFFKAGRETASLGGEQTLRALRPIGLACEQAMFVATGGVNTHKGGIFSLGLLCAAAGRLTQRNVELTQRSLCEETRVICRGIVEQELKKSGVAKTKGEQLFQTFGFTGARGEAASGFITVRTFGLPLLESSFQLGASEREGLLRMLLGLMAENPDTNVISRGGVTGLNYVRRYARRLLKIKNLNSKILENALTRMDAELIRRNLSPGGSADLLAVGWLLSQFPQE
ncbi:TPA: triphosphoribosyl-dephospho-CoA synthase CitG [Enterobacter asburiae]|nr:triphosphoribosyl-dephospho-CoA synthase CitG [Enterobacter asburiae]HDR2798939.1 triphosphoribosyl-dephospho-CoA synthase CitG [Enterobacter asburiae]